MNEDQQISKNLKTVLAEIDKAWSLSRNSLTNRMQVPSTPLSPPALVAVSKRQSSTRVDACLRAGQRVFGENRVQEAKERWSSKKREYKDLKLHLIGKLQTNKVHDAVEFFDVIEVVDRFKLAERLSIEMTKQNKNLPCFVQVNTGEEPQKSGIFPGEVDEFIEFCRKECKLNVTGLMCIPPFHEETAMHFSLLREIALRHGLPNLSMGMSRDYREAITFGSTSVRIGTAVFGER